MFEDFDRDNFCNGLQQQWVESCVVNCQGKARTGISFLLGCVAKKHACWAPESHGRHIVKSYSVIDQLAEDWELNAQGLYDLQCPSCRVLQFLAVKGELNGKSPVQAPSGCPSCGTFRFWVRQEGSYADQDREVFCGEKVWAIPSGEKFSLPVFGEICKKQPREADVLSLESKEMLCSVSLTLIFDHVPRWKECGSRRVWK